MLPSEAMYPYTAKEARERGELELWRANFRTNCACAGAIELAIRKGFDGMHPVSYTHLYLPVRHGTGAETLERTVGHVVGTSLPVGGAGTHAVLSAHSGMASAKLFSDIDQLVKGDVFYIHVLGEVLAYEVDQIATVLPSDTSLLQKMCIRDRASPYAP